MQGSITDNNVVRPPVRARGFTLVEMLVVIAIIGLLAGLLLTAVQGAKNHARKVRARSEMAQIVAAWTDYLHEYRRFPATAFTTMDTNAVNILRGGGSSVDNSRRIVFSDFSTSTVDFRDPWGSVYNVVMDKLGNNKVTVAGKDINVSIVVISNGPDKLPGTPDDLGSWAK